MSFQSLQTDDLVFLAQDELVEIFPLFHHPALRFLTGTFGPFRPGRPVDVPLWLAIKFRSLDRCSISRPSFLRAEFLDDALQAERENPAALTELPYFIFEIARLFFQTENSSDLDSILGKLQELRHTRQGKLRRGRAALVAHLAVLQIPHLTASEAADASSSALPLFDAVRQLDPSVAVPGADAGVAAATRLGLRGGGAGALLDQDNFEEREDAFDDEHGGGRESLVEGTPQRRRSATPPTPRQEVHSTAPHPLRFVGGGESGSVELSVGERGGDMVPVETGGESGGPVDAAGDGAEEAPELPRKRRRRARDDLDL